MNPASYPPAGKSELPAKSTNESVGQAQSSLPPSNGGRRRSEESREGLLRAVRELSTSVHRYRDISIHAIARKAQASKATIYRWWPSKAELIREACLGVGLSPKLQDSLRGDIQSAIECQVSLLKSAATLPVFAGTWAELVEDRVNANSGGPMTDCPLGAAMRQILESIFARGVARGDWEGPVDYDRAYETLFGLLFCRMVGKFGEFNPAEIEWLTGLVIESARPLPNQ